MKSVLANDISEFLSGTIKRPIDTQANGKAVVNMILNERE